MQTRAVTLKFYRRLFRVLPFHSLDDKLMGLTFCVVHLPLLALVGFALLHGGISTASAVLLVLAATLTSAALALWGLHHLLAPLRMASRALDVYSTEKRVLPLPTDLNDDMGELLRNVRRTLETVEEGHARLQQLSSIDSLTGLPSRRCAEDYLELAASAMERSGGRLSVALMELNRFQTFNDELGTEAGDRALRQAGAFMRTWLKRKTDWVARWSGEQFLAILLADQNSATEYLENLRREFARQMRSFEGSGITLAIGIAEQRRHEDIRVCVKRADEALHAALIQRQDQVVMLRHPKLHSLSTAVNS